MDPVIGIIGIVLLLAAVPVAIKDNLDTIDWRNNDEE